MGAASAPVASRVVDWDAPLLAAIPAVRAATTDDEFTRAVDGMLRALRDPVTRAVPRQAATTPPSAPRPLVRRVGAAMVLDLPALVGLADADVEAALNTVPPAASGPRCARSSWAG